MLDADKVAEAIVGGDKDEAPETDSGDLDLFASDLVDAVKAGDAAAVADAFRAMFAALEMEPHDEAPMK